MTNVGKMKDVFKKLNQIINIKPLELTKSERVESDFIRIYKLEKDDSFGFAFNDYNSEEGSVTVIYKKNEKVVFSSVFYFETFRIKLKEFIKNIEIIKDCNKVVTSKNIVILLEKEFFKDNIKEDFLKKNILETEKELIKINEDLREKEKLSNKNKKALSKALSKRDLAINELKDKLNFLEKKKIYEEALSSIEKMETELDVDLNILTLKRNSNISNNKLSLCKKEKENILLINANKLPPKLREAFIAHFKE
jgi:hypothetical protein